MSWRTYWTKKEDVADKMLLLTRLDDEDREEVIRSWKTGRPITKGTGTSTGTGTAAARSQIRKVNYKETSDSEPELSEEASESSFTTDDEGEDKEVDDDLFPSTDEDEQLGAAGSIFTMAETRAIAKYIAKQSDWTKGKREWDGFFRNVCYILLYINIYHLDLSPLFF